MGEHGDSTSSVLTRVPSGLPGLDTILYGGFFRGGVYMVVAPPGSGKTILGNQICFGHVARGGRALYVTLLTESHARMLASLAPMAFFDATRVGAALSYVTVYQALEKEGLQGLLGDLRHLVRDRKATLLVIDGFITAGALAPSDIETKKFIHELQVFVELVGCTTLLLTGASASVDDYALRTMVDGLVELRQEPVGMEQARTCEVPKFRGGAVLMGRHLFEITNAGVAIYPRTESRLGRSVARPDPLRTRRADFGVRELDELLGGGLGAGSVTMLLGIPGSGKTLLGLSLLTACARRGEHGLYFGFFEPPEALCHRADAIGLRVTEHMKSGLIEILWRSPLEGIADAHVETLLARIRETGATRVFIDGMGGFRDSLVHADRSRRFFGALCDELRTLGVATLLSDEAPSLSKLDIPEPGLTAMLDNVVVLRHVEVGATVHKLISVAKLREGAADASLRELSIGARGFVVASTSASAEAALAGRPRAPTTRGRPSSTKKRPSPASSRR
jgi:circadian clock protein KaiC